MKYIVQYRSPNHPDAGWTDMRMPFTRYETAEAWMIELKFQFDTKEWRVDTRTEQPTYDRGNSGTH